ncbi:MULTISPECIES: helix-turn-helix domain-containing protein [Micrococcaceae]|uniref:helix-turn-helix domain-containing protein n=1 Tax=Micrococcaceae TaxID=1268 RepID=UPI000B36096E|nr:MULTISPECIES: helix-turn-helix transcriptional regulator [Micrococcaceae]PCC24010.1 XRE family transcriptional regulator [Glutamicibacter sp. BW78]
MDLQRDATFGPGRPAHEDRRAPEPLWRVVLGRRLRLLRTVRGDRLFDVARLAGISPQYLSEIERGIKEPSSEMIAAVAGALGTTLLDLTWQVAAELHDAAPVRIRTSIGRRGYSAGASTIGSSAGSTADLGSPPILALAA